VRTKTAVGWQNGRAQHVSPLRLPITILASRPTLLWLSHMLDLIAVLRGIRQNGVTTERPTRSATMYLGTHSTNPPKPPGCWLDPRPQPQVADSHPGTTPAPPHHPFPAPQHPHDDPTYGAPDTPSS